MFSFTWRNTGMCLIRMEISRDQLLLSSLLVLNILLSLIGGSGALRDVQLILPKYIRRGEDVKLSCNYDLERDQLYMVNWSFKNQEFYRYIPKEAPPQKAFQQPGFYVDVRRSNDHEVYLRNVSVGMSGMYKCSASAEHIFQTLSSTNEMTVVVIGEDMPSIQLDRQQYHPGDKVTVECQSPFSFPPANITWFYNDTKVGPEHNIKTESRKMITEPMIESRISRYLFDLPEKHPSSAVSVYCRATVFNLYEKNSTIQTIIPIPRRLTGTDTLLRPGTSTSTCPMAEIIVSRSSFLTIILIIWMINQLA